jgi:hypothetical protein
MCEPQVGKLFSTPGDPNKQARSHLAGGCWVEVWWNVVAFWLGVLWGCHAWPAWITYVGHVPAGTGYIPIDCAQVTGAC